MLKISAKEMNDVFDQRSVYFKAQSLSGLPWQFLASLHYRERSLQRASNPFQFDLKVTPMSSTRRRHLYSKYSTLTQMETNRLVGLGIDNFEAACILAACFIKDKREQHHIKPDYTDDEVIKELFWSYNGRAYGGPDHSPYVMNGYDAQHMSMVIVGTVDGRPVRTIDHRPGAYTVYKQIQAEERERKKKMGEA